MKYNRHFIYEVVWDGVYYRFDYLQQARKFLKNKSGYEIYKIWWNRPAINRYEFVEASITKRRY